MAKSEEQVIVKYRYALALKKLLEKNKRLKKRNDRKGIESLHIDQSYGEISSRTGLRAATISDIFNGISEVKAYSLFLILQSLSFSYTQFGRIFDRLTTEEILKFKQEIEENKARRQKTNN